jgi:hypothetical protein
MVCIEPRRCSPEASVDQTEARLRDPKAQQTGPPEQPLKLPESAVAGRVRSSERLARFPLGPDPPIHEVKLLKSGRIRID